MFAFARSLVFFAAAVVVAIGVTSLPSRAADDSKSLQKRIRKLEDKVDALEAKLAYMRVVDEPINGLAGPHVIFEGCNVHIRSGSGATTDGTVDLVQRTVIPDTTPLGLGNLVIGYNETAQEVNAGRGGSHNLIVGPGNSYPSVGAVVFGQENRATGPFCGVTGGYFNLASGYLASVAAGTGNTANGDTAMVSGGDSNTASGISASVSGGSFNTAGNTESSVSGGVLNSAGGLFSSVSGGYFGSAPASYDWCAGALFQED